MEMRRTKGQEPSEERWLEVDAAMTGSLNLKDPVNLSINGQFEGTLDAKGNLLIGKSAQVKATIHAEKLVIGGEIQGDVVATTIVEVLATGRINGKITTPRLVVQDGAMVQGTIEMAGQRGAGQLMTVDELARYLEVDASTVTQWAQEGRLPGQRDGDTWQFERPRIETWLAQEKVK